jgi:hypothetical protein
MYSALWYNTSMQLLDDSFFHMLAGFVMILSFSFVIVFITGEMRAAPEQTATAQTQGR